MTENDLLKTVIAKCDEHGLYYYHNSSWKTGRKAGWPDIVIIGHGMLYRELKSETGPVKTAQADTGRRIAAAGGNWGIWRPADLDSGRIDSELRELADCPLLAA